jgi:hypothetical protein
MFKLKKTEIIAQVVGMKTPTKFQFDRSKGLKAIALAITSTAVQNVLPNKPSQSQSINQSINESNFFKVA